MATSKKFSELPAASSVGNGDLFAIAHEDALAETGYVSQKLTAAQAGQKVNGDTEYPTSLPSFPENGQNPFAALEKLNADIDALYPVNTASGAIANFTTSLEMPLVALSSTIVAQQAGTGTPSPSNPRAISGFSSVSFTQQDSESTTVDSFTIQLGQTVYGGSIDAKNGKLRVTWGSSDLGSLNWTRDAESVPSNPYFFSQKNITKTSTPNVLCSIYQVSNTSVANMPNYSIKADGNGRIIVINQDYTDASSFKTAMAGIIVVYELATPVEIDITENNFTTIVGENNIFSDCGEVTVGFKQGIQEYIDAKIAATQALILNS